VLVGPNASGKSNVLRALNFFKRMMIVEKLPPVETIQDSLWAGEANHITFQLYVKVKETPTAYKLDLKADGNNLLVGETLLVKDRKIISIQNGQGVVRDEDGENETRYKSNKLALKSTGDSGNKLVTNALTEFIKGWNFYDFQPGYLRSDLAKLEFEELRKSSRIDDERLILSNLFMGSEITAGTLNTMFHMTLQRVLSHWHKNDRGRFDSVSESLAASMNLRIDCRLTGKQPKLYLLEKYKKAIPLVGASDGTLRLVAYYILINHPELPPLIALEEPERNLHPGALPDIANVLEQLAERTQVIITTHSSQLLDAFKPNDLSDSLGVYSYATIPSTAQRSSTLRLSADTDPHWTVGLPISESAVPFSIAHSYKT
jgi:predicted ATPase